MTGRATAIATPLPIAARLAPIPAVRSPYRWAMLGGVALIYFCFGLTTTAMAPLVPLIAAELGLSHAAMGAVLGAWPVVYIVSAVPCGLVLDRVGLRWSLTIGATVIAASGMLRAVATGPLSLWVAVAVFGLGGPLVSVGAPKLIGIWFEGRERGVALGLTVSGPALGSVTALALTNSVALPLLGGRWRAVLIAWAALTVAATGVWLALSAAARSRAADHRSAGSRRADVLAFLDVARARPVQLVLLMSAGIFFFNHGLNNWLPEILRTGGMDATSAGYWAAIPTVVGIAGALVVPRLAHPGRHLPILFVLLACAGTATLLIESPAGPALVSALWLQGIARGSMMAVAMLLLMDLPQVGARRMGAAGGLFFSVAEVGGVLGPVAMGALYDWTGRFTAGLRVMTVVCAGLIVLLWTLRATSSSHAAPWARGRSIP